MFCCPVSVMLVENDREVTPKAFRNWCCFVPFTYLKSFHHIDMLTNQATQFHIAYSFSLTTIRMVHQIMNTENSMSQTYMDNSFRGLGFIFISQHIMVGMTALIEWLLSKWDTLPFLFFCLLVFRFAHAYFILLFELRSKSLWRWYIATSIMFLDIIHRPEIGASWIQLSRFYLRTGTEFSLRNAVFKRETGRYFESRQDDG
jgi:hypothetical protein